MMEKFLDRSPPGIRRWWYGHEIEAFEEGAEISKLNFDERKAWAGRDLIEKKEVPRVYKEFKDMGAYPYLLAFSLICEGLWIAWAIKL